jgi:hypothetical protein
VAASLSGRLCFYTKSRDVNDRRVPADGVSPATRSLRADHRSEPAGQVSYDRDARARLLAAVTSAVDTVVGGTHRIRGRLGRGAGRLHDAPSPGGRRGARS